MTGETKAKPKGRARSISNEEVALIKAMLGRGMRNRDIQFHFNRPDRPVNSGRITGIKNGSYGADVEAVDETSLDQFLAESMQSPAATAGRQDPHHQSVSDRARTCFRVDGEDWVLADGENVDQECKETFDTKKLFPILRAIAGLATNRGGFIFLGVKNAGSRVVGLPDRTFHDLDIVMLADKAKTYLTPTPVFSKHTVTLGSHQIGVIHVEKFPHPPVIACKGPWP